MAAAIFQAVTRLLRSIGRRWLSPSVRVWPQFRAFLAASSPLRVRRSPVPRLFGIAWRVASRARAVCRVSAALRSIREGVKRLSSGCRFFYRCNKCNISRAAIPFFYRCEMCELRACSIGHGLAGRRPRSQGRNCKNQIFKTQLFASPKSCIFALKILTITNLHYFSTLHFFLFNIIKVIGQNSLFRNLLTFSKLENKVH